MRYYHKCTQIFVQSTSFLSRFSSNLNYFTRFSKNTQISNFMKIRPVGAEWQQNVSSSQTAKTTTASLMPHFIDSKDFMYLYIRMFYYISFFNTLCIDSLYSNENDISSLTALQYIYIYPLNFSLKMTLKSRNM